MSNVVIFLLMILMHIIDDFVLQPKALSHLKQKKWWEYECDAKKVDFNDYKNDYVAALCIHGISWSIMIHLPIIIFMLNGNGGIWLLVSVTSMALIHSCVDDLKANDLKINLCKDQLIHLLQISVVFALHLLL